jgi:hypothetical protein
MVMRAEVVAGGTEGSVLEIEDTRDSISRGIAAGHRNPQQGAPPGNGEGKAAAAPPPQTATQTATPQNHRNPSIAGSCGDFSANIR